MCNEVMFGVREADEKNFPIVSEHFLGQTKNTYD